MDINAFIIWITGPCVWSHSLQDWSYIATILAVIVNFGFLLALLKQINQGGNAVDEAKRAADAAQASVKETLRNRVDERSPRIIAQVEPPSTQALQTAEGFEFKADAEYTLPEMNDAKLTHLAMVTVVNEGHVSGKVHLNGFAEWLGEDQDDMDFMISGPFTGTEEEVLLKPGASATFAWSDGHTLADWADAYNNPSPPNPKGASFMEIIVSDAFEDGVIDNIFLEMSGRAIVPVEGKPGKWKINDKDDFKAIVYPIKRRYRSENTTIEPPWSEVYQASQSKGNEGKK